ncbi:MAG: hypothetical protein AB7K24_30285, partial [Gemmataceae bacterium]
PGEMPTPTKLKDIIKANKPEEAKLPLDGVSCGGCHGPSADWNTEHIDPKKWRFKLNPDEKAKVGFWDLRDAETRSTLCLSCHVGNVAEGKVVTHAMMAAGHPPLPPIEIALFSKNEPQHWRDAKDVPWFKKVVSDKNEEAIKNYHLQDFDFQQTKLAMIGGVVSLRETMRLVRDRANLDAKKPQQVWPELLFGLDAKEAKDDAKIRALAKSRWPDIALAHSDCYACHHDLKFPGFRQERGYGYHLIDGLVRTRPGRPVVRAWPTVMVEAALLYGGGDQKEKFNQFRSRLQTLVDTWQSQPFGKPEGIAKAADDLVKWSDEVVASLKAARYDKESSRRLLHDLCKYYSPDASTELIPDYETARQVVALLKTIYDEYKLAGGGEDAEIAALMGKLADQVDLYPYKRRNERLQVVLGIIREKSEEKPTEESLKEFSNYLKNIGDDKNLQAMSKKPNKFLQSISYVTNEALTDGFIAASDKLQTLSDEELAIYLKTVNDYDPAVFRALIGELKQKLK